MNLLLISKTAIIKQIFKLVTIKLEIELTVSEENTTDQNYDFIVIEDELLNDEFKTSSYCKKFGVISKNINNIKVENDFSIAKPFMPSTLLAKLEEQILSLLSSSNTTDTKQEKVVHETILEIQEEKHEPKENLTSKDIEEINDSEDFLDTLAQDISEEIIDENDESIVSTAVIEDGGILDNQELNKIQDILDFNSQNTFKLDEESLGDEDWLDLSDIIDKAIDEVREYQFKSNEPIKLVLNNYSMNELSPLLHKLDQKIIDSLTNGEEINLKLKIEKN